MHGNDYICEVFARQDFDAFYGRASMGRRQRYSPRRSPTAFKPHRSDVLARRGRPDRRRPAPRLRPAPWRHKGSCKGKTRSPAPDMIPWQRRRTKIVCPAARRFFSACTPPTIAQTEQGALAPAREKRRWQKNGGRCGKQRPPFQSAGGPVPALVRRSMLGDDDAQSVCARALSGHD